MGLAKKNGSASAALRRMVSGHPDGTPGGSTVVTDRGSDTSSDTTVKGRIPTGMPVDDPGKA